MAEWSILTQYPAHAYTIYCGYKKGKKQVKNFLKKYLKFVKKISKNS